MKTIRKKILIISILIIFLILFIIIGNIISNKSYVSVTTFKKSYNYLTTINDDNEEMEVLLYITNEKASFTDINKINNCKLYDDDTEININLSKITNLNYSQNINGSVFHLFSYIFSLPKIKSSTIDNLKDLGLFQKDDDSYEGTVTVTVSGNSYTYATSMKNDKYYVNTTSGTIKTEAYDATNQPNGVGEVSDSVTLKTACVPKSA